MALLIQLKQYDDSIEQRQLNLIRLTVCTMIGQAKRMPYSLFHFSRAALRTISRRFLHGDLAENGAQFVKVHRFSQMKIETGFPAALNIIGRSKSGQRYRLDRSFSLSLGH